MPSSSIILKSFEAFLKSNISTKIISSIRKSRRRCLAKVFVVGKRSLMMKFSTRIATRKKRHFIVFVDVF